MVRKWMILVTFGVLAMGWLSGEIELTPEQQVAVEDAKLQISKTEQAEFNKSLLKANKGDPTALYETGSYYIYGYGVEQDIEKGYALVLEAAEKGNADAQNMLGDYYGERASDDNYATALLWWRKAAEQDHRNAQYSIGQLYDQGLGVPQSDSLAVFWFSKAAEQGLTDAMFALCNAYYNGKGVAQDYREALFWVLLAFPESWDEGYDSIENIARHVTDDERKAVETRAQKWLGKHKH